jgi:hypothetical protein
MAPVNAFEQIGVKAHGLGSVNSTDVDDTVLQIQPDLVIFDRFITEEMFGWRVRNICPQAAHVIDTQDIHFLRHARQHLIEEYTVATDPTLWAQPIGGHPGSAASLPIERATEILKASIGSIPTNISTNNSLDSSRPSPSSYALQRGQLNTASSLITDVDYYRQVISKHGTIFQPSSDPESSPDANLIEASKRVQVMTVAQRYPVLHANVMRELAAIHRSDLTLVVSHFEKDMLIRNFGISPQKLEVASFFYEDVPYSNWKAYRAKLGFSMIGHFKHPPNRDGIYWLIRDVWPKIKRHLPEVTLDLFGAHPDKADMALTNPATGVRVVGTLKAEELTSRLQRARISLAPLRFGAGIKGKITENWLAGTPVVTTSIGAESMSSYARESSGTLNRSFGGAVADTAEGFARAAVNLYIDSPRWHQARAAGYDILTQNFNMAVNGPLLQNALRRVVEQRDRLRAENLTGSILWSAGYRYNEMFGRFLQMKQLASQKQTTKFVDDIAKTASQSKTNESPSDSSISDTSVVRSKTNNQRKTDLPTYQGEREDEETTRARGLGQTEKSDLTTESFVPNSKASYSVESNQAVDAQADADRKFVFGVLAAEQERFSRIPKKKSSAKPSLADIDEMEFVAFKKSLK